MRSAMTEGRGGIRWMRWMVRLAAALVVFAVLVAFAIHTAPVRRYALRRAIITIQETLQIRLQADDLDYNLFTLRVILRGVRASALTWPERPFFSARRVTIGLRGGVRLLSGIGIQPDAAIDFIDVEGGRVRVVRSADGRTNLPISDDSAGDPEPLRFRALTAPRLAFEYTDEANDVVVALPAADVNVNQTDGRIDLRERGRIARGATSTTIHAFGSDLTFDGRNITLARLELRTDDLAVSGDGRVGLLVEQPDLDMRLTGRGDIARLARWAELDDVPRGALEVDAHIKGSFSTIGAHLRTRAATLHWSDITVRNLTATLGATTERLDIQHVEAEAFGGRVVGAGEVLLAVGESHFTASWADVEIERLVRALAVEITPTPTGRATGTLEARGTGTDFGRWIVDARTRTTHGITARNRVSLAGTVNLHLEGGRWRLRANEQVGGVPMHAVLHGRIDTHRLGRSSINGTVTLPPVATDVVVELVQRIYPTTVRIPPKGTVRAEAIVSGTIASPEAILRGDAVLDDVAALAPGTPLRGPADVRFETTLRQAQVHAVLRDFNMRADATIDTRAPYNAVISIEAPSLDLERVLHGIETPVAITGSARLSAHATGPLDEWRRGRATVTIAAVDARVGALAVTLAAPAKVAYENSVVEVQSIEMLAGDTRVSATGALPLTTSAKDTPRATTLLVTASGDLAQFTNAIVATGLIEMPAVSASGPAALLARVTGSLEHPRVAADLELGPGTLQAGEIPAATSVQLRAHSDGEWIEVREVTAEWQGSRVQASGRVPIEWAGLPASRTDRKDRLSVPPAGALSARLTSVTPQVLAPFLEADTLAQIEGSLDASVRLQSTALDIESVSGEVQLDRMDIRIADLPIAQRVPTRIAIESGFARVTAWQWTGQGGTLGVEGRVRLADRQAALLATGRFDLRMLTPFVRDAGITTTGALEPRLSITGVLTDPRIDGDVAITGGEIRLADPRVVATGITVRAALTHTTAQLTRLDGVVNGGRLSGGGTIEFATRGPFDASLVFAVDGMALEFPEGLRSELNARLGLNVVVPAADMIEPTGSLTGTVTVLRSSYREPVAVATQLLAALRTRRLAADATVGERSVIDNLAVDVRVITEDDVSVDNNLGRLQLGTDVRVVGTIAAPALAGRAQLREGGRLFLGRNIYVIESGTIDFANTVTIEPDLGIRARTRAGGEEIVLTLKGTPDNLESTLTSTTTPELGEADLLSLLLTGRRLDDISGREGQIVGEQVLGYLSGDVLGLASRAVGLDSIRLGGVEQEVLRRDPTAVASELDPTTRLTFGKSLGRSVDITYSQSLREAAAQAWIVDYRPVRALELRFVSDDEELRSYEFRHDVAIGRAAVVTTESTERPAAREDLRVGSVTVRGDLELSERRVRSVLKLGVGDRFDFTEWQRDRERLEALYHEEARYEARIDAQRAEHDRTIALTYEIIPGPRTVIVVSGQPLEGATIARVRTAWSQAVVDEFLVDQVQGIVTGDLARQGFQQARVEVAFRLKPEAANAERILSIHVEPGLRVTSRSVRVDVPDAALERDLHAWIAQRRLTETAAIQPAAFERETTAYLRSRGHLRPRVTVGTPVIEGTRAIVRVQVEPGPVFTTSDVAFVGAARIAPDTLQELSGLTARTPFDPAAVDRARERLAAHYRREGFPEARVDVRQLPDDKALTVAVTFVINEGPRQVITAIDVQGNRAIDEDVITRALKLPLNEPLAADAWLQARRRVFDTGLFRRVDVAAERAAPAAPGAPTQPMRARVTVEEWPALRLRYGFEVAEQRPEGEIEGRELAPGLSADLTRRTLFGRAVTLGAALDYQRREQAGRAFLSAPTMLGWPIESLLLVERARETFTAETRVTDTSDVALEQRVRLRPNLRLSYAYRFTRDHTFDTDPDPNFPSFDLTVKVARLNAAAAYDTRDDPVDTTRGLLLSSSFDYAPAALGSEFRYAKQLTQAYYFRPWRGVVFASAGRFGVAGPLDDEPLIPSERFKAGGSHTVRGAIEDGLGPSDFFGPTGGEAVVLLNQEVRFPIYRWLRGVGFIDAGNVFDTRSDIDFGDLVGSAGLGLRLATPFALLRVDYGRLFSPGSDGRSGRWMFGIGQAF